MTVKKTQPPTQTLPHAEIAKPRPPTKKQSAAASPTLPPSKLPKKFSAPKLEPDRPEPANFSLPTGERYPILVVPREKIFLTKAAKEQGYDYAGQDLKTGYHIFTRPEHNARVKEILEENKRRTGVGSAYTILVQKWE